VIVGCKSVVRSGRGYSSNECASAGGSLEELNGGELDMEIRCWESRVGRMCIFIFFSQLLVGIFSCWLLVGEDNGQGKGKRIGDQLAL